MSVNVGKDGGGDIGRTSTTPSTPTSQEPDATVEELRENLNSAAIDYAKGWEKNDDSKMDSALDTMLASTSTHTQAAIVAALKELEGDMPDEKVGTEKMPLNATERGYNIAVQDLLTTIAAHIQKWSKR